MSKIFPTFDEIKEGYCVFTKIGRYRGMDEDGNPLFCRCRTMEVYIAHNCFQKYVAIDIVLNRKFEKDGFRYGYEGKRRSRIYEYSESGYLQMLADIQKDLKYDAKQISALLQDLKGVNKSVAKSEKGDQSNK